VLIGQIFINDFPWLGRFNYYKRFSWIVKVFIHFFLLKDLISNIQKIFLLRFSFKDNYSILGLYLIAINETNSLLYKVMLLFVNLFQFLKVMVSMRIIFFFCSKKFLNCLFFFLMQFMNFFSLWNQYNFVNFKRFAISTRLSFD